MEIVLDQYALTLFRDGTVRGNPFPDLVHVKQIQVLDMMVDMYPNATWKLVQYFYFPYCVPTFMVPFVENLMVSPYRIDLDQLSDFRALKKVWVFFPSQFYEKSLKHICRVMRQALYLSLQRPELEWEWDESGLQNVVRAIMIKWRVESLLFRLQTKFSLVRNIIFKFENEM